jgi:MoxR-like ATPase
MRGREFVTPDDVKELAVQVLGHRLILTPEARARGLDGAKAVTSMVDNMTVPGAHV